MSCLKQDPNIFLQIAALSSLQHDKHATERQIPTKNHQCDRLHVL